MNALTKVTPPEKRRYFYKDPLAAAWMAKHFGMKFQALYGNAYDDTDYEGAEEVLNYGGAVHLSPHPDSLHLLKPRVGDLLRFDNKHFGVGFHDSWGIYQERLHYKYIVFGGEVVSEEVNTCDYKPEKIEIIQRNGIPFMWPESESGGR